MDKTLGGLEFRVLVVYSGSLSGTWCVYLYRTAVVDLYCFVHLPGLEFDDLIIYRGVVCVFPGLSFKPWSGLNIDDLLIDPRSLCGIYVLVSHCCWRPRRCTGCR